MTTPDLKPCPFCGSPAKQYGTNMIACTKIMKCGGQIDFGHYTGNPEPLYAAWNTRADLAAVPCDEGMLEVIERVENACQEYGARAYYMPEDIGALIEAARKKHPAQGDRAAAVEAMKRIQNTYDEYFGEEKTGGGDEDFTLIERALTTDNAELMAVREILERIATRPDLPNPERDADWKNCQKWSSADAREALAILDSMMKREG